MLQERPDRLVVRLPNRMILVAQELHAAPVVSAQVWIKTGSIYEQEHVGAGLSHFLEHLLSGGSTGTRTEAESNAILGRIGAETNASTGLDNVRYYINTTREHAAAAIDLLSDWMQNALITDAEYQRERQVIQREFEFGQGSPQRIYWKLTQQARYRAHPARHPTIGYLDEFLAISRQEIYDFYKRMYVPNNMLFVVAGDIDRKQVIEQLTRQWAPVAAQALPELKFPVEPAAEAPREVTGAASVSRPQLRLAWPGTQLGHDGDYALDLLGFILGQGETSRLVKTIRDQQQLVTSISAYNLSFAWGQGFFGIDAQIAPPAADIPDGQVPAQQVAAVREAILAEVARLQFKGVTEEELARAKRQTMAAVLYEGQSAQALAGRLAQDILSMADPDYLLRYAEAVQQVTAGQIQAAANRFLQQQRLITVTLVPDTTGATAKPLTRPADPPLEGLTMEPVVLDNAAWTDRISAAVARAARDVAPVTIDPIQRHVLDNGLRVIIQRSTLVPAVAMQMYRLGGLLSDPPGQEGLANAAASMITKGTATRSADDIDLLLDNLGAGLGSRCGNNTTYTTATCLSEDWKTVLGLFADVTLHPSFPAEQWQLMRPRILAAIARQTDSWNGELNTHFRRTYFGGDHPWAFTSLGRAEVVSAATVEQMAQFHRDHLAASESVLAVIGDADPAAVRAEVQRLFAAMPAEAVSPFRSVRPRAAESKVYRFTTDKPLAAVQIGFGPGVARSDPDYPVLGVLCGVLSSFPTGWLEEQLRGGDGQGLAYAVWTYQVTGLEPGYVAMGFNTQPGSVDEALGRAMKVVARATSQPVSATDLARAKAAVLASEFLGRQTNDQRAAEAALNELYGVGLNDSERFIAAVQALTPEQLLTVAKKYLANPVTVVIEPAQ